MYKALIIDDEKMARTLLESVLKEFHNDIEIVDSCKDLPTGVKSIRKNNPDLVFLDIEMPGHSGLELLDFFEKDEIKFKIVFVTAYNQYAIHALRLSAVDYILKPIDVEELSQAIDRFKTSKQAKESYQILKQNLAGVSSPKMAIYTVSSIKFIEIKDIIFLKAEGSYTLITLKNQTVLTTSKALKFYDDLLSSYDYFFRSHKSYIINLNYVREYIKADGGSLIMEGELTAGISIDKSDELIRKMGL
ncbi:MAG: response regulator transcription factor [Bacteroidia bacterium]|nr:response regulator transcription factor [Bacteroidia bacterium]MCC7533625.1 response regulator transcription factor [Bacteroidia bacterium]